MFHVKRIFALVAVALVLSLAVVSAFAAPTSNPSSSSAEIGGALSREATIDLYHAIETQVAFLQSSTITASSSQLVPFLLTATDNGADMWTYRVYLAPPGASISSLGAEWQSPGADLTVTGSTYVYECVYNFASGGGMGQQVYKYFGSNALALRDNEWAVWAWRATFSGMSSLFQYGYYNAIPAVRDWLNAVNAFDGYLTPEIVENEIEQAKAEGFREGEKVGIASGVASSDEYWRAEAARLEAIAREEGDREGYERAVRELGEGDNASYVLDIPAIFSAIPASAKSIINSAFGFEVFGINVAGLLSVILIISVVGFIVAKLSSR